MLRFQANKSSEPPLQADAIHVIEQRLLNGVEGLMEQGLCVMLVGFVGLPTERIRNCPNRTSRLCQVDAKDG
jgi:hypothetical protein